MRPQREWDLFCRGGETGIFKSIQYGAHGKILGRVHAGVPEDALTGEVVNQLSGPEIVEVVNDTYDAAAPSGWSVSSYMMNLGILISNNLGVMNLLQSQHWMEGVWYFF